MTVDKQIRLQADVYAKAKEVAQREGYLLGRFIECSLRDTLRKIERRQQREVQCTNE